MNSGSAIEEEIDFCMGKTYKFVRIRFFTGEAVVTELLKCLVDILKQKKRPEEL